MTVMVISYHMHPKNNQNKLVSPSSGGTGVQTNFIDYRDERVFASLALCVCFVKAQAMRKCRHGGGIK